MNIEQLEQRLSSLRTRLHGINEWIRNNPTITDPNAYEIMDCNIAFAEIIRELKDYYVSIGEISEDLDTYAGPMATVNFIANGHPDIEYCYHELGIMDDLRHIATHPFFTTPEVDELYCSIKSCQDFANYDIPNSEDERRIKRELLCKSMSVPFYIWQVQRTEKNYQYDNQTEYNAIEEMYSIYSQDKTPAQFDSEIKSLIQIINKDYKYRTPEEKQPKK